MTISRRDAFRVAADVLERSDWLTVDLLADLGDENASENADRIVEILREEVARMGAVPATTPPPSGVAGAPTYATGGYVGPVDGARIRDTLRAASDRAHALPAYARPTVTRPVFNGGPRTSGPLDPEIHAALVRSVERAREARPGSRETHGDSAAEVREAIRADFLNDDGLMPWER